MRVDHGIIMARGDSKRMGSPKGAVLFNGKPLLEHSCKPFGQNGIKFTVVTTPELLACYEKLIGECSWLLYRAGEGTARTCKYAFDDLRYRATHLWLMPIDLPSVKKETVVKIKEASLANNDSVIIPTYNELRGHPVVVPITSFEKIDEQLWQLEMRDVINSLSCEIKYLQVDDHGIVNDCDTQSDLEK
jgi:molybdenum cofactor cytidylyltransferase